MFLNSRNLSSPGDVELDLQGFWRLLQREFSPDSFNHVSLIGYLIVLNYTSNGRIPTKSENKSRNLRNLRKDVAPRSM